MTQQRQRYPIGMQTFSKLREEGYLYVDKTDMVYRMTHGNSNYIFLSRPRRFGKSLLVSTLKAYFEGRKELFKGLAIESLETEWTRYPVLHFSMSGGKYMDKDALVRYLSDLLTRHEKSYKLPVTEGDVNIRLANLTKTLYEKTGKQVVILIDEYDAPLLDVMHEKEDLPVLRKIMRNFYSPLKDLDPYLRFVFMTGITKFSQLSIFSELNNIENITMDEPYATLCGITEEEMLANMKPGIAGLAEHEELSYDEAVECLKQTYDGYHFTWPSPDIYNPYSLLNAMSDRKIDYYWFGSGTPTYLIKMLQKFEVLPTKIGGQYVNATQFDAPTETMTSAIPLLYQSGYITIKDYHRKDKEYLLDIPNKEVRVGLMDSLLPEYVAPRKDDEARLNVRTMNRALREGRIDDAMEEIKTFLSTVPYTENTDYEGHYQSALCIIFSLLGYYDVDIEVRTPKGRVDMVLKTDGTIYLFEIKLNGSAKEALEQTDIKNYPERFALYNLPIVKVGVNFSTETRTITEWEIAR